MPETTLGSVKMCRKKHKWRRIRYRRLIKRRVGSQIPGMGCPASTSGKGAAAVRTGLRPPRTARRRSGGSPDLTAPKDQPETKHVDGIAESSQDAGSTPAISTNLKGRLLKGIAALICPQFEGIHEAGGNSPHCPHGRTWRVRFPRRCGWQPLPYK